MVEDRSRYVFTSNTGGPPYPARMDIGVHGIYIHTAYGVPPPNALPTLRIHQILYIITSPTDTDYVRTEIPIPYNVVLDKYVVSTFTGVFTVALLPVYYTTRFAVAIPTIHDFSDIALQLLDCIVIIHNISKKLTLHPLRHDHYTMKPYPIRDLTCHYKHS